MRLFRAASAAFIKASGSIPPGACLRWGMPVHCGRKRGGQQLTAKYPCIIHAACKLASCSLLERNCREFEIHFLFPHSRATARKLLVSSRHRYAQTTVSFCFPSSIPLQRCCFNASAFLARHIQCQSELYTMHSMQYPTCSLMYCQYMRTLLFLFLIFGSL